MSAHTRRRPERGIILVAVLLAVAIMSVMVVAAAALTRAGIGSEELEQRRLATHFAMRSGLEAAKAMILAMSDDQRLSLDGSEVPVDLGEGVSVTLSLRDAAGLADLNRSDPALIEAVVAFSGIPRSRTQGLAATITKLRKAAAPEPAAAAGAAAGSGTQKPADNKAEEPQPPILFLAIDQLLALIGVAPDRAAALGEGLTVYSPTGLVNPLAAPPPVLQSVPGITPRDLSDVAFARKIRAGSADGRIQQLVQRMQGLLAVNPPSVFIVGVRLDSGPGLLPGSTIYAVLRLNPKGPQPFGTLALEEQ